MNDKIFNIDFKALVVQWLPTFLRAPLAVSFAVTIIIPVMTLYIEFLKQRKQNLIRIGTTCQKFSMQKRLNDLFDPVARRIKIVKAVRFDGTYEYTKAEDDVYHNKTLWLFSTNPIFLRSKSELTSEYDFIVLIPNTTINQYQLIAEIEYYMLQSKNYKIEVIS